MQNEIEVLKQLIIKEFKAVNEIVDDRMNILLDKLESILLTHEKRLQKDDYKSNDIIADYNIQDKYFFDTLHNSNYMRGEGVQIKELNRVEIKFVIDIETIEKQVKQWGDIIEFQTADLFTYWGKFSDSITPIQSKELNESLDDINDKKMIKSYILHEDTPRAIQTVGITNQITYSTPEFTKIPPYTPLMFDFTQELQVSQDEYTPQECGPTLKKLQQTQNKREINDEETNFSKKGELCEKIEQLDLNLSVHLDKSDYTMLEPFQIKKEPSFICTCDDYSKHEELPIGECVENIERINDNPEENLFFENELEREHKYIMKLCSMEFVKGQVWCLICSKWFNKWRLHASKKLSNSATHPGSIDNTYLIEEKSMFKQNLVNILDYVLIPLEGWNYLYNNYGSVTPEIKRWVVEYGSFCKQFKVEIYPLELQCTLITETLNEEFKLYMSRAVNFYRIMDEVNKSLKVNNCQVVKLMYKLYGTDKWRRLTDLSLEPQELGFHDGQKIRIEIINNNEARYELISSLNRSKKRKIAQSSDCQL